MTSFIGYVRGVSAPQPVSLSGDTVATASTRVTAATTTAAASTAAVATAATSQPTVHTTAATAPPPLPDAAEATAHRDLGNGVRRPDPALPPPLSTDDDTTTLAHHLEHALHTFAHESADLPGMPAQALPNARLWGLPAVEPAAARLQQQSQAQQRFVIPLGLRHTGRGSAWPQAIQADNSVDEVEALEGVMATFRLSTAGAPRPHSRTGSQPHDPMKRWMQLRALRRAARRART